jgi:hypothetical protein
MTVRSLASSFLSGKPFLDSSVHISNVTNLVLFMPLIFSYGP